MSPRKKNPSSGPESAPAQPPRLSELPDVLNVKQYCAVLHISEPHFWVMKRHDALPVKPLKMKTRKVLFSNQQVQDFVNGRRKAS